MTSSLPRRKGMTMRRIVRRTTGLLVALALALNGSWGAVPAQAAGSAVDDYTSQAAKAGTWIVKNESTLRTGALGPRLDGLLALKASGKTDPVTTATMNKLKADIRKDGPEYCKPTGNPVNVGGCAKIVITLKAIGEPTTYNKFDYATPVTSATTFNQYATNNALAMIALQRMGKPIPKALYSSVIKYATTDGWPDHDTDGLMLTALSHVTPPDKKTQDDAIQKLKDRIAKGHKPGAGWDPGPVKNGDNVNTTAWVAAGLYRTGTTTEKTTAVKAQAWLVKQQQVDGSFKGVASTMMATTQVVPALRALQSYDNVGANPAKTVTVK